MCFMLPFAEPELESKPKFQRAELITLRENERPATHGAEIESLRTELGTRKMELEAMRQKAMEADALCKEAEAKVGIGAPGLLRRRRGGTRCRIRGNFSRNT